jgi:hypothetical protein
VSDFDVLAAATFVRAGAAFGAEDLGLAHLIYDAIFPSLAALGGADVARFPFEAVDPSRAPDPT